jgi:hypothetical protein
MAVALAATLAARCQKARAVSRFASPAAKQSFNLASAFPSPQLENEVKISLLLVLVTLAFPCHGAVTVWSRERVVSAQGRANSTQSPRDELSSSTLGDFSYTAASSASDAGAFESSSASQDSSFVLSSAGLHVSATGGTHASAGGLGGGFSSETQNLSRGSILFSVDSPTPFTLEASVSETNGATQIVYLLDNTGAGGFLAYFAGNQSGTVSGTLLPGYQYSFYFETQNNNGFGPSPVAGAGTSDSSYSTTLNVSTLTPYELWKQEHLGNSAAADDGDPEGDVLCTLNEYGIATLPHQPRLAPAVTLHPYAEGERLRILLPRNPAHYDVTVKIRAAPNPDGPWTDLAVSTLGAPFAGPGYVGGDDATPGLKTVEVRDLVNRADAPARFIRVEVSL